jgi:hypothetical protein
MPSQSIFTGGREGGFHWSRLVEQLVPLAIVGGLTVYANGVVTTTKVDDLKSQITILTASTQAQQQQLQQQSRELAGITAQLQGFIGVQTTINATMDARATYLERIKR